MSTTSGSVATRRMLREVLGDGVERTLVKVTSSSMAPRLREGDRIIVERVAPRSLKPGDIIVFDGDLAGLVVHRLIWRTNPLGRPTHIYTKGDALEYLDRCLPVDRVLGRVTGLHDGEGRSRLTTTGDRLRCTIIAAKHGLLRWLGKTGLRRAGR